MVREKYKRSYWDYSNIKFNIKGRVCLKHSSFWAILGLAGVEIIHPFIQNMVSYIPTNIKSLMIVIIYITVLLDWKISSSKILGKTRFDRYLQKLNIFNNN